jgi:hypothetical protein
MISYPKLERLTLPCIEKTFLQNILKDPPKGIFTRRIDKVGDTQLITNEIDASCDRANDAISVYSRGIDPMVKVNYSNYANTSQASTIIGTNRQSYYPYRVARDGAFRPPALRLEDLVPLSRLPRMWTYAYTNPELPDFSKNSKCDFTPSRQTKDLTHIEYMNASNATDYSKHLPNCNFTPSCQVKDETINVPIRPTASFAIQTSAEEPYDIKNIIKNGEYYSVSSNIGTIDSTDASNKVNPTSMNQVQDVKYYTVYSNTSQTRNPELQSYDNVPNIHDKTFMSVYAPVAKQGVTVLGEFTGKVKVQDPLHSYNVTAPVHINRNHTLQNVDITLDRNTPLVSAFTSRTGHSKTDYINTDYRLAQKVVPGSFDR